MRTESQTRWEKGVDPELAGPAATYASQLLVELAGARWTRRDGRARRAAPRRRRSRSGPARPTEVLGLEFAESRAARATRAARLRRRRRLDRSRSRRWRARDVRREIDVVEEVARFRLEDVPLTLPTRQAMFGRLTHVQRLRRQVEDVLVGAGFFEAYTYSLQPERSRPGGDRAAGAAQLAAARSCARRSPSGLRRRRAAQRRPGQHRRPRCSRSRTSTCPRAGTAVPRRALAAGRHRRRATSSDAKGAVEARLRRAAHRAALRARAAAARARPSVRPSRRAGSRSTAARRSTASGARSSSTSPSCSSRCPSGSSTAT